MRLRKILLYALMTFVAFVMLAPILWMISTSFKQESEAISGLFNWLPKQPTGEN